MDNYEQTGEQKLAAWWKTQIAQCDKEFDHYNKRCDRIMRKYRDERRSAADTKKRLNLFWSNVQTLKPAIYSRVPQPICERRFLDRDTTGRVASTILERGLRYEVSMSGFDNSMRKVRDDYLTVARGQVWVRYNPQFGEPISPTVKGNDEIVEEGSEQPTGEDRVESVEAEEREIVRESLAVDHVNRKDYYTFPARARTEQEIEGKGRRIYMSRQDLIDKFGTEKGKKIPLDHVPKGVDGSNNAHSQVGGQEGLQATIYEIWWKPERKVYFISKEYDSICMEADDPLKLEGFWPCPPALYGTITNDSMIPIPDYVECQDQYEQIDDLTRRIDVLTAACKVVGVYDAAAQSLKRVFQEAVEPNLIPVESWAMFAEKGGLKGAIDWVPIEQVAKTLKILISVRTQLKADLNELTGVADTMRGTSDARETLGGQRLKSNGSSMRLQERQDDMARFCRDTISIMAEIISEHFDAKTLIQVSGALFDEGLDPPSSQPAAATAAPQFPPSPPAAGPPPLQLVQPSPEQIEQQKLEAKAELIQSALDLLRQDKLRGFRIEIETDSTIQKEAEEQKAEVVEFFGAVTKFIETAAQVSQIMPEFAPLAGKMLQFGVRRFRVGRDLESAIEEFVEKAEQDAKSAANQQKPPSPEAIKAQSEKYKADSEIKRQMIENEGEARNGEMDLRSKNIDLRMKELDFSIAEIQHKVKQLDAQSKANQAVEGAASEGGEKSPTVHPHLALAQIADAAKTFDTASRRNAAPRIIHRGSDGKATHIVTDFKEG